MPIMLFEIKRNRLSMIIWSAVLSFLIAVCVFIYPEIAKEMENMKDIFANMIADYNRAHGTSVVAVDGSGWIPPQPLHPTRGGHRTVAKNLIPILKDIFKLA